MILTEPGKRVQAGDVPSLDDHRGNRLGLEDGHQASGRRGCRPSRKHQRGSYHRDRAEQGRRPRGELPAADWPLGPPLAPSRLVLSTARRRSSATAAGVSSTFSPRPRVMDDVVFTHAADDRLASQAVGGVVLVGHGRPRRARPTGAATSRQRDAWARVNSFRSDFWARDIRVPTLPAVPRRPRRYRRS